MDNESIDKETLPGVSNEKMALALATAVAPTTNEEKPKQENKKKLPRKERRELERQMRRKEKKQSKEEQLDWNDLEEQYSYCYQMMQETKNLLPVVQEALPYVPNDKLVYVNKISEQFGNDIVQMAQELTTIHESHVGRKGEPDIDSIMDLLSNASAYATWVDRFQMVIQPTIEAFRDIVYESDIIRNQQQQKSASENTEEKLAEEIIEGDKNV